MPKFMDHHPKGQQPMSPEAMQQGMQMMQQMRADIQAGKSDEFGVKPLNVFMGADGESWCLTEAPNAHAVVKAHGAKGAQLTAADVVEVTSLV